MWALCCLEVTCVFLPCGMGRQMTEVEKKRREKHYASGKWMKNHPHHHAEWEARQAEEGDGSDEDDEVF